MGASCWQGDQEGRKEGEREKRGTRKDKVEAEEEIVAAIIFSPFLVASLPPATRLSKMVGRRSPILHQL